jgi:hypothetical protein
MTERWDGRLEDVGGQDEGSGEGKPMEVKYGEDGRRKGRIEYDRQVCAQWEVGNICSQLYTVGQRAVQGGMFYPILGYSFSEAHI